MTTTTKKIVEIDAEGQSLGRLCSRIAILLRGKHLASFEPHIQPNIDVVVSNIDKIKFTGTKYETKKFFHYSGYPGGLKERTLGTEWEKKPKEVLRHTVYRMLPVNRMRDKVITHLKFK
jgi:large subunit ribosomal protein L13